MYDTVMSCAAKVYRTLRNNSAFAEGLASIIRSVSLRDQDRARDGFRAATRPLAAVARDSMRDEGNNRRSSAIIGTPPDPERE